MSKFLAEFKENSKCTGNGGMVEEKCCVIIYYLKISVAVFFMALKCSFCYRIHFGMYFALNNLTRRDIKKC